ncbi:MAG: M14 family metallopeptidase [Comamonadaceae bacterium]|nr:M14 family metallopeptidase [Comamonadaceae bacterium]
MIGVADAFASSYAKARVKFLEAAATASARIESFNHPLAGKEGEQLALDVALDGDPQSKRLLIVSSGLHGVDGFGGSGVQVFALHDSEWRDKARAAGMAVLYLHALNPYGFSHLRYVTQENVVLNRNFVDFTKPRPVNLLYRRAHSLLLPEVWPPDTANREALQALAGSSSDDAWLAALCAGQYEFPDGMFYGGHAPTWSHLTLHQLLARYVGHAEQIAWIDLHTGEGATAEAERVYVGCEDAKGLARARQWWGEGVRPLHESASPDASSLATMWSSLTQAAPQAECTEMVLKFGTACSGEVLDALRADHWLALHPMASSDVAAQIQSNLKRAFYTDADSWKGQVISQARQAMFQSLGG